MINDLFYIPTKLHPFLKKDLVGWYRARDIRQMTGYAISTWKDRSGKGNHLIQNNSTKAPILNQGLVEGFGGIKQGKTYVHFDGTGFLKTQNPINLQKWSIFISLFSLSADDETVILSERWSQQATTLQYLIGFSERDAGIKAVAAQLSALSYDPSRQYDSRSAGSPPEFDYGTVGLVGSEDNVLANPNVLNKHLIFGGVHDGASITYYKNNVAEPSVAVFSTKKSRDSLIVGYNPNVDKYFNGYITEILVYNEVKTVTERIDIIKYLAVNERIITNSAYFDSSGVIVTYNSSSQGFENTTPGPVNSVSLGSNTGDVSMGPGYFLLSPTSVPDYTGVDFEEETAGPA